MKSIERALVVADNYRASSEASFPQAGDGTVSIARLWKDRHRRPVVHASTDGLTVKLRI